MKFSRQFKVVEKNIRSDAGIVIRTIKLREDCAGVTDIFNNVIDLVVSKKEFERIKINSYFVVDFYRC